MTNEPQRLIRQTNGQHTMTLPAPLLLHGAGKNNVKYKLDARIARNSINFTKVFNNKETVKYLRSLVD